MHFEIRGYSAMASASEILIDNATLSGVERLLGRSKTLNLYNKDNDIACFEKLLTAILFSDKIYAVNDYKEAYKRKRIENFSFVEFMNVDEAECKEASADGADFAKSMLFSFEGSTPAGDAAKFFESLRIDPQMRWDVFTSSEYLTLSLLTEDTRDASYEGSVTAAFANEVADMNSTTADGAALPRLAVNSSLMADLGEVVQVFRAGNPNYVGMGHKNILEKIVFGYGWAAERSRFYARIAGQRDMEVALSPLRDAFCESCCRIDTPQETMSLLRSIKESATDAVISIRKPTGSTNFAFKIPFLSSYFISKSDNPTSALKMALDMRNDRAFAECRNLLFNLRHLDYPEKISEMNSIFRYLNESLSKLLKEYSVASRQGPSVSFSFGISGPSISVDTKIGSLFREHRNKPFAKVFRSMATDIVNVERMGALHDKMCSQINLHSEARHVTPSLTPSFMKNKQNDYGRPADVD